MAGPVIPDNLPELGIQGYLVYKAFGPAAGAVGEQLSQLVHMAGDNVRRVVEIAIAKLGDEIEESGEVSGRSLVKTLTEATISDDEVVAEYLGGVLASARTDDPHDDRSVSWTALIGRLSSDQLRLHYALYAALREQIKGQDLNLGESEVRRDLKIYVGFGGLFVSCGWWEVGEDPGPALSRFGEAFDGLHREDLVADEYRFGGADHLVGEAPDVDDMGVVWMPSLSGVRLFLWGHGLGAKGPGAFLRPDALESIVLTLPPPENAQLSKHLIEQHRERTRIANAEREATVSPEVAQDDASDAAP